MNISTLYSVLFSVRKFRKQNFECNMYYFCANVDSISNKENCYTTSTSYSYRETVHHKNVWPSSNANFGPVEPNDKGMDSAHRSQWQVPMVSK